MNNTKQHLNDKLQKSSLLFLQLGLVLALFLTYVAFEFESSKKSFPLADVVNVEPGPYFETDVVIEIERKVKKPVKIQSKIMSQDNFIKIEDDEPILTDILDPIDIEDPIPVNAQIDLLPEGDTDPEPIINDISFKKIENAPIFPGCEGLEEKESKACFTKGISKFVNKKFNTGIAEGLNGKQRIWVEFIVDKTGVVTEIKARSPYKQLEKEAIRVVEKLPKMVPGKQRKTPVNVKYTLPIVFQTY